MDKKPNILIFNPDQWRGEALGHLGNPAVVTPNLDRVCKEDGVSFSNAFCQNPVCTPSRCSFMSGWYPHVRGHRTMYHMMHEDEPVLLKTLKDNGYFVWWAGKNDLIPATADAGNYCNVRYKPDRNQVKPIWQMDRAKQLRGAPGSDTYYSFYFGKIDKGSEETYHDPEWANVLAAIDFIKNYRGNAPFCLNLALTYPHPPYAVEEPWYSMIDRKKVPARIPAPEDWSGKPGMLKGIYERQNLKGWDEQRWTELRAVYYGMCSRVDRQFGMLMSALKDAGIYGDTAVFMFSDHGDFTGDYGLVEKTENTFEDVLVRVPLIVKPPEWIKVKPRIYRGLVELTDFSATVSELSGIKFEYTNFGKSLVPLLCGDSAGHRDAVFCEGGSLRGEMHCKGFDSASAQNPEGLYWPRVNLQCSGGPEHTKAVMCRTAEYKYVRRLYEKDELYDLESDPSELVNRIDDPSLSGVLNRLKDRLLAFYLETGDVVPYKTDKR